MVSMKKTNEKLAEANRFLDSRLKQLDQSGDIASRKAIPQPPIKTARRQDQRSCVSIAGSACNGTDRSTGRRPSALRRAGVGKAHAGVPAAAAALNPRRSQPRPPLRPRTSVVTGGVGDGGIAGSRSCHGKTGTSSCHDNTGGSSCHGNTGASSCHGNTSGSNSSGAAEVPLETAPHDKLTADFQWIQPAVSRKTSERPATRRTTNSTTEINSSSRTSLPPQLELNRRSTIKLKQLPLADLRSAHNEGDVKTETSALTVPQQRDRNIFNECRFIPSDTFYKKVQSAPNQERMLVAAPKCFRGPGNRMLYDIAQDNWRHHQDVNFDFTREMLRKTSATFCRTSQFRHALY